MVIDPDYLLGRDPVVIEQNWTQRDTILYALGIGCEELDFVFEERLKALPTMAVVLGYPGFMWRDPAMGADWTKILHGEQSIIIHKPLPSEGVFIGENRITHLFDKGAEKGAIALVKRSIRGKDGTHYADTVATTFLRGDGGFGGSSEGAPVPHPVPTDRAPDLSEALKTANNAALIYRLSGDLNPLHIDPEVAQSAGFDRPILHGLATLGVVGRSLISELMDNDPARLKRMNARFSKPVFPGETIRTDIWREGDGKAAFQAFSVERDTMVLNNGYVEFAA
ncbi:3-alpha,7-alpha,12-alpha-trihydroxy-5-beta-cholest-24-enoyl-CoA hydratase [Sphingorhabdus pulchriflava]|uniref:3-alpha,7-alpha, 12-alpha-trihydroxy-5-beta-cholest-24-enoyl-CoA hydratase n=1 Tax=Sphingorhabdus pulchriflava TaxID=2292257 RepID=A0A371BGD2_9SPHN|nr:MaoC family dehydratase [Sphingorhabdus pulchriflava]RDV06557.1 3-alpha,7-alpha,12-alpha-trihydroxy-5-beta-cholest-24-enoyl-CoA hydratase [Sphingorhabdus pulchriflava]